VEPILATARPHLLGLGAQPIPADLNPKKQKKFIKPGETRPSEVSNIFF